MHCEWYLLLHNLFGKRTLYHCGNRIESLNSCGFICDRANRKQMYCIYWRDVNKFCGFSFSILKECKIISFCTTAKFSTPPKNTQVNSHKHVKISIYQINTLKAQNCCSLRVLFWDIRTDCTNGIYSLTILHSHSVSE